EPGTDRAVLADVSGQTQTDHAMVARSDFADALPRIVRTGVAYEDDLVGRVHSIQGPAESFTQVLQTSVAGIDRRDDGKIGMRRHAWVSSGCFWKQSSACGFASASVFLTVSPWITARTASSEILPETVRGMSSTCRIFAGTWRGVVLARTCLRILSRNASSRVTPSRRR